jgi:hypothetical protein
MISFAFANQHTKTRSILRTLRRLVPRVPASNCSAIRSRYGVLYFEITGIDFDTIGEDVIASLRVVEKGSSTKIS